MTAEELIAFEDEMVKEFEAGNIKAPLHLSGGNHEQLLKIFEDVHPEDWICGTWRFHWHALLKGVPRGEVKRRILEGRSIALCFPEYRVISSAIVGGIAPIAVGLAWAIKRNNGQERVWCFLGDMAARTGIVDECVRYSIANDLPVEWVVEDNNIGGTHVDTRKTWGDMDTPAFIFGPYCYQYELTRAFVGIGKFIPL